MKKISAFLVIALVASLGLVNVQAQSGKKGWVVSKDVQKVANKKQYESTEREKSHLTPVSYNFPAMVISKDVQKVSKPSLQDQPDRGNIASKGTPNWVVSKGVHKINKENRATDTRQ